jgi:hypothetical protein
MIEKKPTYRVEIRQSGTPPNETYGWKIHRNSDVLPILRSRQVFVSRIAGLGRVDKLNPDADGGKQHECGEALGQFVVAGGDPT